MMIYRPICFKEFNYLNEFVNDIYELRTNSDCVEYSTAPNGIVGISLITNGVSEILIDNKWQKAPNFSIYGLIKRPDVIKISPNFREIAIGFKPYFLQLLVNENMTQVIQTKNIDANDVFKNTDFFYDQLCSARTDFEMLTTIEQFISKQLNTSKFNDRLLTAMKCIYDEGITTVSEISSKVNLSSTSIRNLFNERIGRSPKDLISILRINKILKSDINSFDSLTELGYHYGYYDQAHFIHDFQNVMGLSPKQYFNNDKLAFDFYNSGRWEGDIFGVDKLEL
jgi:AraC-like DNA-binding protein